MKKSFLVYFAILTLSFPVLAFRGNALPEPVPTERQVKTFSSVVTKKNWLPCPPVTNREFWDKKRDSEQGKRLLKIAEMSKPPKDNTNLLAIIEHLEHLVPAVLLENGGQYLPQVIEMCQALRQTVDWRSAQGVQNNFRVDAQSLRVACVLDLTCKTLGPLLPQDVVEVLRDRILAEALRPLLQMLTDLSTADDWIADFRPQNMDTAASVVALIAGMPPETPSRPMAIWYYSRYALKIMSSIQLDGYCYGGAGLWNLLLGKYFDITMIVNEITHNKIKLINSYSVREMWDFPEHIEMRHGLYPEFGNADFKTKFAKDVLGMRDYLFSISTKDRYALNQDVGNDSLLRMLLLIKLPRHPEPKLHKIPALCSRFPETGVFICRGNSQDIRVTAAIKCGVNHDPEVHCDIGSFCLTLDDTMPIVDPGPGSIMAADSFCHSVPSVDGKGQIFGIDTHVRPQDMRFFNFEVSGKFNLTPAYPTDLGIVELIRNFTYSRKNSGSFSVTDSAKFSVPRTLESAIIVEGDVSDITANSAVITQKGKKLLIKGSGSTEIVFSQFPLPGFFNRKLHRLSWRAAKPMENVSITIYAEPYK